MFILYENGPLEPVVDGLYAGDGPVLGSAVRRGDGACIANNGSRIVRKHEKAAQ